MGRKLSEGPVTILFSDMEGSTALHSVKGDVEATNVLAFCDSLARQYVSSHRGRAIKSLGDGLLAVFTSPRRAVNCALAIQQALTEHGRQHPNQEVRIRIGLHTGEVTEAAGDIHGGAVHAAARICARAHGGEILVSEVVRQLCEPIPDTLFSERGRVVLKGFPGRWRLYSVSSPFVPAISATGQTPFVGRTTERAQIRTLMCNGLAGRGAVILIGGEPGVGKTRLSGMVAEEARYLGFHTGVGHCYDGHGNLPFMPWLEIVESAAQETPRATFRDALGQAAAEMARVVPQLRRMFNDIPPPLDLPLDQQRRYTFANIREYIARVASRKPQLLILEDLHWADESTLIFLENLVDLLPTISVVLVGTYRDPPIDVSPALANTLTTLVRHKTLRLTLRRHSEDEVASMLRALTGHAPPQILTEAIYAETDGNAFFVEEVFRHLLDSGAVLDDQGEFRSDLSIGGLQVPENVRLVLGQRLDRLSEASRKVLTNAAIIGRRFSFELLEGTGDSTTDTLLDAIDEAEQAALIAPAGPEDAGFSFSHELIRQVLLTRLSMPRRQRTHLQVANALERIHGTDVWDHSSDIAHHLLEAGPAADRTKTAEYLIRAGDRALTATAFEEALRHFNAALHAVPKGDLRRRADVLLRLGRAQRSLSQWEDTVATWKEALPTLEILGDLEGVADLCYELSYQLGWAYRMPESLAVANRGLAAIGTLESPHRTRLLAVAAAGLTMSNRFEEAKTYLAEATDLAQKQGDSAILGEVGFVELFYKYSTMQFREAIEPGQRAERTLREAGSPWHLASVLAFLNVATVFQGLFKDSDTIEAELYPLANRLGHRGAAAVARRSEFPKGVARHADVTALDALSQDQASEAAGMGPGWAAHAKTLRGIVEFWRGDWKAAQDHVEEAARMTVSPSWFGPQHGFLILFKAFSGQSDEALATLYDVHEAIPRPGKPTSIGPWTLVLLAAEAVGVIHDKDAAQALYPLVLEALARGALLRQYDGRLIETAAGMVAAAADLDNAAQEHFEAAYHQAEDIPHLMEKPHVRHFYGRFLLDRGSDADASRAGRLIHEAIGSYRDIGMPRHEAMAKALLTRMEFRTRMGKRGGRTK